MELQEGLGKYPPRNGELPDNGLTLHDLGELIRRAGWEAGFIVESEFKVFKDKVTGKWKRFDWVWLKDKEEDRKKPVVVVAFEIEGRDVSEDNIENDVKKFKKCQAPLSVIALFQVDHDRTEKKLPPKKEEPVERVKRLVTKYLKNPTSIQIDVYLDENLFAEGGIEKIIKDAKEKQAQR